MKQKYYLKRLHLKKIETKINFLMKNFKNTNAFHGQRFTTLERENFEFITNL